MKTSSSLAVVAVLAVVASSAAAQQPVPEAPAISGHVLSEGGRPLTDAEVHVDGVRMGVRTGADGAFRVSHVPKGLLTISVRMIGYLPAVATVLVPQPNDSLTVTLLPMHPELATVKVVAQMNVLAGIVVDEQEKPIPGADIEMIGNRPGSTTTGDDGWFTFKSVRDGPVVFRALKPGYVAATESIRLDDWRGVVVHMERIDSTLSPAKQELLSGTGNASKYVWRETQSRFSQRTAQSVIVTNEELEPLGNLTLGEAVLRSKSAAGLMSEMQRDDATACVLIDGVRMVGPTSLDIYDAKDVDFVELYPPGTELSGSIAQYMRFANCPTTQTLATGKRGPFYAVIWLKD